jgi:hypothetical protein
MEPIGIGPLESIFILVIMFGAITVIRRLRK